MQRVTLPSLFFFILIATAISRFAFAQDSNNPLQSQGDNQQQQQYQSWQPAQQQPGQPAQQQPGQPRQQQPGQPAQQQPGQPRQQQPGQPVQQQPGQPVQQQPGQPAQTGAGSSSSPRRSLLDQKNSEAAALEKETRNKVKAIKSLKGINAVLETSLGNIKIRLFNRRVPKTVYNFVSLAEGTQAFRENSTNKLKTAPFYDGLLFHRVVPNYVIQTGDPLGTGRGGPGYKFEDEPHPALRHKKAGIVSMANFGPNTNGSQFFITLKPMPDLDFDNAQNVFKKRGNTVFGEVTEGMEVVRKISEVPRDNFDKPLEAVVLKRVIIHRQP